MIWQASCGHVLSCCLENHFRKNKERGQQGGGTFGIHWNSNDLTKKGVSQTLQKCYQSKTPPYRIFGLHYMSCPHLNQLSY